MILVLGLAVLFHGVYCQVSGQCTEQVFLDAKTAMKDVTLGDGEYKRLEDMHTSAYHKSLHNGSRYLNFYFLREITHGSSRYLLSRYFGLNVYTPMLACFNYGGHLAEPRSEEELMVIDTLIRGHTFLNCVYLGIEKLSDGKWYYMKSRSPAFTKFGPKQPDGGSQVTCATLWDGVNWLMDDDYCGSAKCHIVCQVPK